MNAALAALLASDVGHERIESFLQAHEFPLVDRDGATFVFYGRADQVSLRHWVFGLTSSQPFQRVAGTDFWWHELKLPAQSRIEYKLEVTTGGLSQWITDPLNPHYANDPYGSNSVCQGFGYEFPEWAQLDPEARRGTLETLVLKSDALGDERTVRIYLPARYRKRARYPLLVTHDGDDYLRFSGIKHVLDNLIHRLEIPPMIVALTNPASRLVEYAADPRHARFLATELLPHLESHFPLIERPTARGLLGASFGAVSALFTAWQHPGVFGNLLLQSGSFGFSDIGDHRRGPAFDPVVRFVNEFRAAPGKPGERLFLCCGIYESLIYENRSMVPLFQSTGMDVRWQEAKDGHNWENWRDRLRDGLTWLFPGPLQMVYE